MTTTDKWPGAKGPTVQPRRAAAVTTDDNTDLTEIAVALWIGVSGDVVAVLADDSTAQTFKNAPAGLFPFQVRRVKQTGTTATNILALFS